MTRAQVAAFRRWLVIKQRHFDRSAAADAWASDRLRREATAITFSEVLAELDRRTRRAKGKP